MKIRNRITFLFTAVVIGILFLVCYSVFYFSALSRQADFRKRLKVRAITTVRLLVNKNDGIDKEQLKKLDQTTFTAIQQKSIVVYNYKNEVEYEFNDTGVDSLKKDTAVLNEVKKVNEVYFYEKERDGVVVNYVDQSDKYITIVAAYDTDGFARLKELKFILIVSFFSGAAIPFLSGLFFSYRLVKPIKKISGEVHEISSQNLSRRIALGRAKDELHELSSTFNDLLTRLQDSFETQRRFIANASHELSTPLTSISSQLEITLQNERSMEEYKDVLYSVYEDVRNLTELTRSLLEIAKASGTTEGIELSLIRMDELLMRMPAELRKIDAKYTAELHFDMFPEDEKNLLVFGNADLLFSAIKNILVNACKYSEDHLAVVNLYFTANNINIKVSDSGPGIKEEEMHLVFQPFYRSTDAKARQGFGLGLSLALRIIKLHKGEIDIQSNKNGSVFIISLPVANEFYRV